MTSVMNLINLWYNLQLQSTPHIPKAAIMLSLNTSNLISSTGHLFCAFCFSCLLPTGTDAWIATSCHHSTLCQTKATRNHLFLTSGWSWHQLYLEEVSSVSLSLSAGETLHKMVLLVLVFLHPPHQEAMVELHLCEYFQLLILISGTGYQWKSRLVRLSCHQNDWCYSLHLVQLLPVRRCSFQEHDHHEWLQTPGVHR